MGLDGVELIMAVEEEFKITISNSDAEQCITVGGLVDFVYSRVRHSAEEPCPSQQGFYVVRRKMMNMLGLQRSQIRPEIRLDDLIGRRNRRKVWLQLVLSLMGKEDAAWVNLVRPKRMNRIVVAWIPGAAFVCTLLFLPFSIYGWSSVGTGFVAGIIALVIGDRLTVSFKQEFPDEYSRVKDLVKFVKTLDSRIWSKEDVFNTVRAITVEQLGVKESQVKPESHFVDDLGVG